MAVSEVSSDPGTLAGLLPSFSTGKATGALDNGLITDSLELAPGELSNPWVQLAISIHSPHDANEPIGSFYMSGFGTAMLTYGAFEAAGRNPARHRQRDRGGRQDIRRAVASSARIHRHRPRRRLRRPDAHAEGRSADLAGAGPYRYRHHAGH